MTLYALPTSTTYHRATDFEFEGSRPAFACDSRIYIHDLMKVAEEADITMGKVAHAWVCRRCFPMGRNRRRV